MNKGKPRQPKLAGSHVPSLEHVNRTIPRDGSSSAMAEKNRASKLAVDKSKKRRNLKVASYCCYVLQDPKGKRSMGPRQLRLAGFSFSRRRGMPLSPTAVGTSPPHTGCGHVLRIRRSVSVMTRNADESQAIGVETQIIGSGVRSPASHQCRRGSFISRASTQSRSPARAGVSGRSADICFRSHN